MYYGWYVLLVAAAAMVGTLPGRTQGLGLITEPLLAELGIGRVAYAEVNLWATLIGSMGAIAIGHLLDRFGSRVVLTLVAMALGVVVAAMSQTSSLAGLAVWITLTRALGQSALSVVSLAMIAPWFVRRVDTAMALYSVTLSVGFMLSFPVVGALVQQRGWRAAWLAIGVALVLGLAPLSWGVVRRSPDVMSLHPDGGSAPPATPSGASMAREEFTWATALVGNFAGGWLARSVSLARLMGVSLLVLAGGLIALPHVATLAHVLTWATAMGLGGGLVMVLFFTVWPRVFGRRHLGRIQGTAQALTVVASATGPLLLAWCVEWTGSYAAMFRVLAGLISLVALAAFIVPMPSSARQRMAA